VARCRWTEGREGGGKRWGSSFAVVFIVRRSLWSALGSMALVLVVVVVVSSVVVRQKAGVVVRVVVGR
jgi:hypothetical protein